MSLAQTAKKKWNATDPVFRALLVSVLIHLTVFGSWKIGSKTGVWKKLPLFSISKKASEKLVPLPLQPSAPPAVQEREIQLTFLEVDPTKVAEKDPENAKFYSAVSTEAANPKIGKETATPKIEGKQKEVVKITENVRPQPQPLQPTPPSKPEPEKEKAATPPKPAETKPVGDLALSKPQEQPKKADGDSDSQAPEAAPPTRPRPRTIAEAKTAAALGEKSQVDGGVKRYDLTGSLAAKGSIVGNYDQRFIEAVRQSWYDMLDNVSATKPGKVVLEFRINHKGQISEMRVAETTVNELQTLICQQAIKKPAPYGEWPREMRLELKGDYRDVTFTFSYQ